MQALASQRYGAILPGDRVLALAQDRPHAWGTAEGGHGGLEIFDSRGGTYRCFYWFDDAGKADAVLDELRQLAEKHDVTLQLLCEPHGHGGESTYPILVESETCDTWPSA